VSVQGDPGVRRVLPVVWLVAGLVLLGLSIAELWLGPFIGDIAHRRPRDDFAGAIVGAVLVLAGIWRLRSNATRS
jgi:hypothetical protein